ncbi:bifunctional diaminohydroxyphosphoribosylaminopyrimidine deaminase/5-amino-6-(5-phosphoribosylamino)uracil reductase RibD [Massilia sp. W12]|uniref:bifunctional diaminohydroxyphosphoribosylaminopyrimidine deaminase/5-amino-6-(5-phosphoribosylamino)uracil reductase RibD n=1 Tax=Massilia sp. W12 TaxID=3126507 RepID=UPI0030D0943C
MQDLDYMRLALEQAGQCANDTIPNPRVGCVLQREGQIIGLGRTQRPGGNHAEIEAMQDARARGFEVRGATAYVTLEPCSHTGRTGPCADALIAAGVARVVAACPDANPQVAGQGLARLQAAGVAVECGLLRAEAEEINRGFLHRMQTGLPWFRLKMAASLDGKTALPDGQSQWITGPQARADGHAFRARACAILTGIGTVLADDPQMTVRSLPVARQPQRIIIDSRLQIPLQAKILQAQAQDRQPPLLAYAQADAGKLAQLHARGVQTLYLPDAHGKVDLRALKQELGRRALNEVHVEAGNKLHASLLRAACIDELLLYLAPDILGEGQPMFALPALAALADLPLSQRFAFFDSSLLGRDLRLRALAEAQQAPVA